MNNPASFYCRTAICFLLPLLLLAAGCATRQVPEAKLKTESVLLAEKIRSLSPEINSTEATRAAAAALRYPLQLAREYRATPPAIFNNMLINVGLHPRGLCFQWADDLTAKLMTLHLRTLELHRGVARPGTRREHSCVVLTAPGQDFASGIALDAWRHSGRLHWSPVTTDKYAWQETALTPAYQTQLRIAAEKLEAQPK